MPRLRLALSLSGEQLIDLIDDRDLLGLLDRAPLRFTITGVERIRGSASEHVHGSASERTLEPTVAATLLAERAPRTAWLVAAAAHLDHPYNLARRVASLDHLTSGRAGLLLARRNRYAPSGPGGDTAWGGAGLTPGAPLRTATAVDAARAIAKLWRSWPSDAIAADRASRVYAAANRIVRIDHRGVFDIDGPLTLPTTPQGVPVLAWWAATPDELSAGDQAGVVELVVTPENQVAASATPLWVEVETVPDVARSISRIEAAADAGEVAGVVLRSQPEAMSLADTLRTLIPALQDADLVDASHGHTLRDRLSLPDAELDVADAGPAFPAPQPASAP